MRNISNIKVFCITGITGDTDNTGTVDYAKHLTLALNDIDIDASFLSNCASGTLDPPTDWPDVTAHISKTSAWKAAEAFPQEDFIQYINEQAGEKKPMLIVNGSGSNAMLLSPHSIATVPTVFISHEFTKLSPEQKLFRLEQIKAAKSVLFTTTAEREAVVKYARLYAPEFAEKLKEVSFLFPVPPNIIPSKETLPNINERNRDIVIFGQIRRDKGLESVAKTAALMRGDQYFNDRNIVVIGTVLEGRGGNGLEIIKNDLLVPIYDLDKTSLSPLNLGEYLQLTEIFKQGWTPNAEQLTENLNTFCKDHNMEYNSTCPIKPVLSIELHLNAPVTEVSRILSSQAYAYLPMPRGLTPHSGSLAAAIFHENICFGWQNYSHPINASVQGECHFLTNIDNASAILEGIKQHETSQLEDPELENRMVRSGEAFRNSVNWNALAQQVSLAIEHAQKDIDERPFPPDQGGRFEARCSA